MIDDPVYQWQKAKAEKRLEDYEARAKAYMSNMRVPNYRKARKVAAMMMLFEAELAEREVLRSLPESVLSDVLGKGEPL